MAKAVVAAWAACVKDLQQQVAAASASTPAPGTPPIIAPASKEFNSIMQGLVKLKEQPPLPHAAWKKLVQDVQVTAKLAALYVQTLQQQHTTLGSVLPLAYEALVTWLVAAGPALKASPESHAAAAVRQQLQDSQLLQQLGPAMDDAAARLTAAVAALAAGTTGSSSSSSGRTGSATTQQVSIQQLGLDVIGENHHSSCLLRLFMLASSTVSTTGTLSIQAASPAAPAAMRLMITVFQRYNAQPQLQLYSHFNNPLPDAYAILVALAYGVAGVVLGTPQSCPAASELLLLPEFLSCVSIMLVVTVLGLDTSSDMTEARLISRQEKQQRKQQRQQQQRTCSSGSSGSGLGNGVQLDSLTALSCGLFDILGVTKETVLQAASVAYAEGLSNLPNLEVLLACYSSAINQQVKQAEGSLNVQLLQPLETYLLLYLMLLQLTASIPDSYPGARPALDMVCSLYSEPLYGVCTLVEKRLVQLPQQAAYSGRQLALQLLPWPPGLQALLPSLPQQQQPHREGAEQHRQQEEQPAEWHLVTPSATLLTQLLPLLTCYCLTKQQEQQQRQQEQQHVATALLTKQQPGLSPRDLQPPVLQLLTLLMWSVVPAPDTAAAEGSPLPPSSATAAPGAAAAAADGHNKCEATYSCALHGCDAFLLQASDIISIFEGGIRLVACYAAAATAAAATAAAAGGAASAAACAAAAADACDCLKALAVLLLVSGLCCRGALQGCQYYPSPLVSLALAAGPSSQVQPQFYSLLTTMVKLSGWGMLEDRARLQLCGTVADACLLLLADATERQQQQQQESKGATAAGGGFDGSSGNTAAVAMLPSVFLLGRCCMSWAEKLKADSSLSQQQQQEPCSSQEEPQQQQQHAELCSSQEQQPHQQRSGKTVRSKMGMTEIPSVVQQWLQAGSICDQLAAAGYAPGAVLQQLQQVSAAWKNLQHTPSDTAALLAAAQLLQSTGLALCSFAVPCVCNNPGCTSMAGLSELASVSGRSCICAGCLQARYCGRACQRAAWKQHKLVCGALRAAVAAQAASAGAGTKAEAVVGATCQAPS